MHCNDCRWPHDDAPDWAHTLNHNLFTIAKEITTMSADQSHLDADVNALGVAFAQVVAELKAQAGAEHLDFAAADAFVATVQGEATADAPVEAPPVDQPPVDGSTPTA